MLLITPLWLNSSIPCSKWPQRPQPTPTQAPLTPPLIIRTLRLLQPVATNWNPDPANWARVVQPQPWNNAVAVVYVIAWQLPRLCANFKLLHANWAARVVAQMGLCDFHCW